MLAEHFIYRHGHGIGQIQTPQALPHGDPDAGVQMFPEQIFRQSGGLFAEHDVHRHGIGYLRIGTGCLGGEIVHGGVGIACIEIGQIFVIGDVQQMPVVQACPLQLPVVNGKSHGFDDVQGSTGGGTGTGDVPGVLGNLRFVKYNIDKRGQNNTSFLHVRKHYSARDAVWQVSPAKKCAPYQ